MLPSHFDGLSEVRGLLIVDPQGHLTASSPNFAGVSGEAAATVAVALKALSEAGVTGGLGALQTVHLKGTASSLVGGSRGDAHVLVHVDPSRMTSAVEKAVRAWTRGEAAPSKPAAGAPTPPPTPTAVSIPPLPPRPPATSTAIPAAKPGAAAPAGATPAAGWRDPWAVLRHALGRGQLNEAGTLRAELVASVDASRPGAEPISREDCERGVQLLLEGVGSVMAGDGLGGATILRDLASDANPNTSMRWLALQWSARASVKSGAIPAARGHIQSALTLARQLDVEARALSQWTAAEVLAHDNDSTRALAWLAESRSRFERAADRWGIGQTFLTEARILSALERYGAASEAAKRAAEHLPGNDEPTVLLARLALLRDEVDAAEQLLAPLRTQAAEKVRGLIAAIREGVVSRPDASEYLREHDTAPSQRSLRALARIAAAAPAFIQAREALAWMLLRIGRYDDAGGMFRALLAQPLSGADRASVMLGLGCVANAGKAAPADAVVAAVATAANAGAADTAEAPLAPPGASQLLPPRAAGAGAPDAVFSGQLSSFALPDLLEFLRSGRRTGLLVCSSPGGIGALRFRDGKITSGASPATPSLADLLVQGQKVSADALASVAPEAGAEQPDDVLADRLVRGGHVDVAAVTEALEAQVWAAIRELVRWTDGEFAFNRDEDGFKTEGRIAVELDPQAVLLDVFRERDEASRGAEPGTVH